MSDREDEYLGPMKPRILFVEDDDTLRKHLAQALSDEYEVDAARDGEQALLAVLRTRPEIVITDVVMPGLDGVELVKTLRSAPSTQTIPVLLTSGKAPEAVRIEGFEQGADGYLAKPYTERELRARIRSMIHSVRSRRSAAHREAREQAERAATTERAALLESITDAFYALDRDWRFTYVNQHALDHYGKSRDEMLGKVIWAVLPALKGTELEMQFERALREQHSVGFEMLCPIAGRWIEAHAYPTPYGLAVNFRDIEHRKLAEQERLAALAQIRGRERRLELATEVAQLGIFVWDLRADRVTSENLRSYEIFGRTPADPRLSSADFLERFIHPVDRQKFQEQLTACMRTAAPFRITCRIRRQNDGAWRWLEIAGSFETDADGSPERLIGILKDITERRRGEEIVLESEARFRTLAQAVPALVFVTDADGQNVYTNTKFQSFVGLSADALLGDGWLQTLHPDDRARATQIWQRAVASGEPYEAEYRFRRHDGVHRWFLVRGLAARDAEQRITAWYGTCTDVHEARQTAEALSDEKRTLQILNQLGQAIAAELDLERAVQAVTDAATNLTSAAFGAFFYNVRDQEGEAYTLYALSGAPRESFAKFPMPRNTAVFGPTFQGEAVVRSEDITSDPRYGRNSPYRGMPDGHLPVRSYLAAPVISRSGEVLGGLFFGHPEIGVFSERAERLAVGIAAQASIAIDNARLYQEAQKEIAVRSRVESALRDSERRLNAVLDNATVAVILMDSHQQCVYMNAAAEKLTGFTLSEAQGRRLHDLVHHTRPDGSRYPIEACPIDRAFPQNAQEHGEETFVHKDGTFYSVAFTASPIRDEHAKVIGTIVEVRDIRTEKQAAEALRDADRRKDEFLAVLAHELRNPLAPIRNGLHIMRLRSSADATLQRVVNMMDRQMTHVVRLVDDLLDVSRITRGKLELRRQQILLTDVLANAVEGSRAFIEAHGHELVLDLHTEDLMVDGDPDRLAQVFSNLLSNSAKYTDRGGRIVLTLERRKDEAIVRVQDNGRGIPPEALEQIFEMFAQIGSGNGPHGHEGLGIGLSLARTLVQMHGGSISAFSEGPAKGSTFEVRLPLAEAPAERPIRPPDSDIERSSSPHQGKRVLVVDDNADAAASLAMLLQMEGSEVRIAADGQEAVEQAREFCPDIIFMDIGMPRMDGLEATRRIRVLPLRERPLIVAVTGWGQVLDRQHTTDAGMDHHLVKPVSPEDIQQIVARRIRDQDTGLLVGETRDD